MQSNKHGAAAIGWQLDHPAIALTEPDAIESLAQADVVFLSLERVSALWSRAVGRPVASFRSTTYEREAWRRLAALNRQLRRLLVRGGLLVCRLDEPRSQCRVSERLDDDAFPQRLELNAYHAVEPIGPELATLARSVGRVSAGAIEVPDATHPLSVYLGEFAGQLTPAAAVVPTPADAQPLARSRGGYAVAIAWDQIACLPASRGLDPQREAAVLLAAVDLWRERRLEQPAAALRADLSRPIDDPQQFTRALARALEVLGLPLVHEASADGACVLLGNDLQTLAAVPGEAAGYLVHAQLRIDPRQPRRIAFIAPPGGDETPSPLLVHRSLRDGEALVPMPELLHAASAVLAPSADARTLAQIRRSLAECVGLYHFKDRSLSPPGPG